MNRYAARLNMQANCPAGGHPRISVVSCIDLSRLGALRDKRPSSCSRPTGRTQAHPSRNNHSDQEA